MNKKPKKGGGPFDALAELKKRMVEDEEAKKNAGAKGASRPAAPPSPAPRKKAKNERHDPVASAEEALEFHRLMSNVVPLDQTTHGRVSKSWVVEQSPAAEAARKRQNAKSAVEEEAQVVHEHLRTLVEGQTRFEVNDDGRYVEGRRVDLPPDALRRLRRGLLPIDARVDLHGLRSDEARDALERFLRDKRARGERCVLVVHGKGNHSAAQPVLRGEISAWLSQGRASEHVAGFATATESDGGEGAVYVLLRR